MVLCAYGCNQEAKYKLDNGKMCCESYYTKCPEMRRKNSERVSAAHKDGLLPKDPFGEKRKWNKGKRKYNLEQILILDSPVSNGYIKNRLIEEKIFVHKCFICNNTEWLDKPITLELDHIDGNHNNNVRTNLRFICPNCHSMTVTWKGRNINNHGKKHITDAELIEALRTTTNIRRALKKVGMTPQGKNYTRAYELSLGLERELNPLENEEYHDKQRKKRAITDSQPHKKGIPLLPKEEIQEKVKQYGMIYVGKLYGLTESVIKRYCRDENIIMPSLEERQKLHHEKTYKDLNKEKLQELVNINPLTTVGNMYNVSDNAIRKLCERLDVIIPIREPGYWAKLKAGKIVDCSVSTDILPNVENNIVVETQVLEKSDT